MTHGQYGYIECAYNDVSSRGAVFHINQLADRLTRMGIGHQCLVNIYHTWARYDSQLAEHIQKTKTISGFGGKHLTDFLYYDLDNQDLSKVVSDLGEILEYLKTTYGLTVGKDLFVATTGNKGVNIILPAGLFAWQPDMNFVLRLRTLARKLMPDGWIGKSGQAKADASIYKPHSLWRVLNTYNARRGTREISSERGYKRLLDPEQIGELLAGRLQLAQIWKEPAAGMGSEWLTGEVYWINQRHSELAKIWQDCRPDHQPVAAVPVSKSNGAAIAGDSCGSLLPSGLKKMTAFCIQDGGPAKGYRNNFFFVYACHLRRYALQDSIWRATVHSLSQRCRDPLPPQQIDEILNSVARRNYRLPAAGESAIGKIVEEFFGGQDKKTWVTAGEARLLTEESLKKGPSPVILGIEQWDRLFRGHDPGQLIVFIGLTGLGKTTLMGRSVIKQAPIARKYDKFVVHFSPEDMHHNLFRMYAMKLSQLTPRELTDQVMKAGLNGPVQEWSEKYADTVIFDFIRGCTPADIDIRIASISDRLGKPPFAIHIDSGTYIYPNSDNSRAGDTGRARSVVTDLTNIAAKWGTVIFTTVHTPIMRNLKLKPGQLESDRDPGIYGAIGTSSWGDWASQSCTITTCGTPQVLVFRPKKKRMIQDDPFAVAGGSRILNNDRFLMIRTGWYGLYTLPEMRELFGADECLRRWGLDLQTYEDIEAGVYNLEQNDD